MDLHLVYLFAGFLLFSVADGQFNFGNNQPAGTGFINNPGQIDPRPPPAPECCIIPPLEQQDCGRGSEQECMSRGCCYFPSTTSPVWCYRPKQSCQPSQPQQPQPQPPAPVVQNPAVNQPASVVNQQTCSIEQSRRISCGVGLTKIQCFSQNCCFDDLRINDPAQCFFSTANAPRLSKWSEYSKCPTTNCDGKSSTRTRFCTYSDGRRAPTELCTGTTTETKSCVCKSAAPAEKKCEDISKTCKNFTSLCDSAKTFRENICRKTCGHCKEDPPTKAPVIAQPPTRPPTAKPAPAPVVTQPQPTAPPCVDDYPLACQSDEIKLSCNDPSQKDELARYCAKTCGYCPKATPVVASSNKNIKDCKDKYPKNCIKLKSTCTTGDPSNVKSMRENCPFTCNACGDVAAPTPTPIPDSGIAPPIELPALNVCRDRVTLCADSIQTCKDEGPGGDAMRENCAKTCGTCPGQAPAIAASGEECRDRVDYCARAKDSCNAEGLVGEGMKENCRKTCGLCGGAAPVAVPSPSPTKAILQAIESATPKPVIVGECIDKIDTCASTLSLCKDPGAVGQLMLKSCTMSCGRCPQQKPSPQQPRVPSAAQPRPAAQNVNCKNDISDADCVSKNYLCNDESSYWPQLCRRTCKTCGKVFEFSNTATKPPTAPSAARVPEFQPRPAPTRPSATCLDGVVDCPKHPELCKLPESGWPTTCRRTCNTCGQELTIPTRAQQPATLRGITPTPRPATPRVITVAPRPTRTAPAIPSCRNKILECDTYAYLCEDAGSTWRVECPVTCNTCSSEAATQAAQQGCVDSLSTCPAQSQMCTDDDEDVASAMRVICPVTCRACEQTAPPTAAPAATRATPQPAIEITVIIPGAWTSTVSPPCEDVNQSCGALNQLPSLCEQDTWKERCPATCKACAPQGLTVTFPTVAPAVSKPCEDINQSCEALNQLPSLCEQDTWKERCPVTCKVCKPQGPSVNVQTVPPTIQTVAPAVSASCEDINQSCGALVQLPSLCEQDTWKQRCPRTCKVCKSQGPSVNVPAIAPSVQTAAPTVVSSCTNTREDCDSFEFLCDVSSSSWKRECPKTCNTCGDVGSQQQPVVQTVPPTVATTQQTQRPPVFVPGSSSSSSSSSCRDKRSDCKGAIQLCDRPDSGWRELCPLSCNVCRGAVNIAAAKPAVVITAPPPTTTTTLRPQVSECRDRRKDCNNLRQLCGVPNGVDRFCRKTCNLCGNIAAPSVAKQVQTFVPVRQQPVRGGGAVCKDNIPDCKKFSVLCNQPGNTWRKDCPVTCNTCPPGSSQPRVPNQPNPSFTQPTLASIIQTIAATTTQAPPPRTVAPKPKAVDGPLVILPGCVNDYDACPTLNASCYSGSEENIATMRKVCPITCNSCEESLRSKQECADASPDCPSQQALCLEGEASQVQTMRELCPVTCGSCAEVAKPAAGVGGEVSVEVWSEWSICTATCGEGQQTRALICPKQGNFGCISRQETIQCFAGPCQDQPAVVAAASQLCQENILDDRVCETMKENMGANIMCDNEILSKDCKKTCGKFC